MKDRHNLETAKRLSELRRAAGLTQKQAARMLGTTQSNISQLEHGKRGLSSEAAIEFCRLYGADISELLGEGPSLAESFALGRAESLLKAIAENCELDDITRSAGAYLSLCVYRMLRSLYALNPHNSSELFSLPEKEAEELCMTFIGTEPERLCALIEAAPAAKRSMLELPVERSAELRGFIKACEDMLLGNNSPDT